MARTLISIAVLLSAAIGSQSAPLFSTNAAWRLFKGRTEASSPDATAWRSRTFNDAAFTNAAAPFWYDTTGDTSTRVGGTRLDDMQNSYTCVFLRKEFVITNAALVTALQLNASVDDGFVAWINGTEVARTNMPGVPGDPVTAATLANGATEPVTFQLYLLTTPSGYLVTGTNVLAIQAFNTTAGSSDFDFDCALDATLIDTNPPVIVGISPAPGTLTSLNSITVTFSEPVSGVDGDDFLIDGFPADSVSGSGASYTFTFLQPPYGSVQIGWRATNGIADLAVPPNPFDPTAPSANWFYTLNDVVAPTVTNLFPPVGASVQSLSQIEVTFSEDVVNVDAADLRINGQPATNVTYTPGGPFVFRFPPAAAGSVSVVWAAGHGITDLASPPNAFAGGSWNYTVNPNATPADLIINEFLANNEIGLTDEDGEQQGWVEIFNRGSTTVNLANWALTDDETLPGLWTFPARALGPGQYLVVFCSGKDRKSPTGTNLLHTNFKMNRNGEHLGLYSPDSPRVLVHGFSPTFPEQRNDNSYGYDTNGALRYFATPTPGRANGVSSIVGVVTDVHFAVSRGFYTQPFDLTLTTETRGATIRYTTDGREPTELTGTLYTFPLRITNTAVIRATALRNNYLPSVAGTHTYIFNASAAVRALPVISLVTASNNLYGPSGIVGISGGTGPPNNVWVPLTTNDYHNTDKHGIAWERPLSAELIQPADNSGFQVNCGIRVHGSDYTRPRYQATDKFAYRLYFRGAYGAGKLDYPFFQGSAVQKFDQIILRAGHNDVNPFIRDEMTRRLHNNLGAVTVHGNLVNLFVNGVFKGFYNPTERPDENWIQSWYQSEQRWDVIKQFNSVVNGDLVQYSSFNNYLLNQNINTPSVYQEVARRFDLTNFVDYLCLNIYTDMGDWPANNWVMGRERTANGIWRYYVWDGEWACGIYGRSVTRNTFTMSGGGPDDSGLSSVGSADIARYYQKLYTSPEFRLLFADRIHRNFFNSGAITDTNFSLLYESLHQQMIPVLSGYDNSVATTWIPQRRSIMMGFFNQYGLIASSNAPVFNQFGGRVPSGFNLTMIATNGGGTIYFTTNGGDPRVMFSGTVAPNAVAYTGPVALGQTAVVRARTLNGTNWSAVTEATFEVASLGIPLRITEIMYNPIGGGIYEFIELQNVGSTPLDLSAMYFEGITYTFPPNSSLAAGARLVLSSNTDTNSFNARYPGLSVFGSFAGNLNNGGEKITLRDRFGNIVVSVDYDDENGWPTRADGAGYSLEIVNPLGDPDDPANWRASAQLNGTPGAAPTPPAPASVRLSELMATNVSSVANGSTHPDWIEIQNTGGSSAVLDGWSLTDDSNPRKFVFPAGTTIPAGNFLVVWCDDTTNTTPGLHTGFSLKQSGDNVQLYDATTNLIDAIGFGLQLPDSSIGRVGSDWVLNTPTPGAANTAAPVAGPSSLSINEWLANALPGQPDWIELYNTAALPVPLRGCWLTTSNTIHQITSLSFIAANGYVQLFADEGVGADHLDFKLSATGETISLYDPLATLVNSVSFSNAVEGVSRGRLPDGSATITNFVGTVSSAAANYVATYNGPVLNEVLARNVTAVTNAGRVADYVELFNPSGSAFSLAGMSLSVDSAEPGQWVFPPGASVPGNGFVVIWCDNGLPASTNAGAYNTGRALNGDSGGAYLFNAAGQLVNSVEYGFQIADRSIGLVGGAWKLLALPTPGAANSAAATLGANTALRFNEWMAQPADGPDWFELFNTTNLPVDMSGLLLTDDPSFYGTNEFRIPPLSFIGGSNFVQWVADSQPDQGRNHVSFRLDAQGDTLRLYGANGTTVIDTVAFGAQSLGISQGRLPDGFTNTVSFSGSPTPGESNYRLITDVVINEVATYGLQDIELQILGSAVVDGWYLSDNISNLKKFRIPDGVTVYSGGFVIFQQPAFQNAFTFDRARGGELWLSAADAGGNLTGYRTRVKFGAASPGVSFGRYRTELVAQSALTFPGTNAGPLIGPVVINEIMYHPPDGVAGATEFIELRNLAATNVDLFDAARPSNTWHLADGVQFAFPTGTTLAPGAYLVVVDFDPVADPISLALFRSHYSAPSVTVVGPYSGKIDNSGETIELLKPELPDGAFVPYVTVDKVAYRDSAPWPSGAVDGGGSSLQRRNSAAYGNDAANWLAAGPTVGGPNASSPFSPPTIVQSPASANALINSDLFLQAAATGLGPISWQWRFNGAELSGATNSSLHIEFLQPGDAGSYDVYALNAAGPAFSAPAQVTVVEPPIILNAPPGIYPTNGGSNVTFSVSVGGTPPLRYQWQLNGADIPGAVAPSISLSNLIIEQSGNYSLSISNAYGTTSTNITLLVLVRPGFTNQPLPQTVLQGGTATFSVVAGPDHPLVPLTYRWLRNGAGFFTSSVPFLVITNCQTSVSIRCSVTNLISGLAGVSSSTVPLTVLPDFDGDGMADAWEVQYGFNTNSAADATLDFDGDGMINRDEYIAGTNPLDASSVLKLALTTTNSAVLTFVAQSNIAYTVQYRTNLSSAVWASLSNITAQSGVRTVEVNAPSPPPTAERYYRIVTPPAP